MGVTAYVSKGVSEGTQADRLAFFLLKNVNRAIRDFEMIRPGDRIAVAVSGGKDSLSLLHLLAVRRRIMPEPYEIVALHVRGDATGITARHEPLEAWLAQAGITYRVVVPEIAPDEALPMGCQRCAWLRRKALFTAADAAGCGVLAYAHHADDAAQTALMNLLYGGSAWTLRPSGSYFGGRFRLIRPLFYVPETELARLSAVAAFPPPPPLCPQAGSSRRRLAREMLRLMGADYLKQGRTNLIRAGLRGLQSAQVGER